MPPLGVKVESKYAGEATLLSRVLTIVLFAAFSALKGSFEYTEAILTNYICVNRTLLANIQYAVNYGAS